MGASRILLWFCVFTCSLHCTARETGTDTLLRRAPQFVEAVSKKAGTCYHRIRRKTETTLNRLAKWEEKIFNLLQKADPETAARLFGTGHTRFSDMLQQYRQGTLALENDMAAYDAYRDKLYTTIGYLDSGSTQTTAAAQKARNVLLELDTCERQTAVIKRMIRERRAQLAEACMKLAGSSRLLQKIDKEGWYYAEALANYRDLFTQPGKAEELVLAVLNRVPAYQRFIQENSWLSTLFRIPGASRMPALDVALQGLQTRAGVNSLIQTQIAAGGPNAAQAIQQNMQQAQGELSALKDKWLQQGGQYKSGETPGFRPNKQKTKTFLQRLEYGANIQSQKASYYFPVTSDIGAYAGYRLDDKGAIGIGGSYKVGWGSNWRNIRPTGQGMGLRSYADYRLKGSFYFYGGYELNYRNNNNGAIGLPGRNQWQPSALAGLSKVVSMKTKWFKKTKIQCLYDFLSYRNVPRTPAFIFRAGYQF
ncbi:MAG: hypothetical protein JNM68_12870 [Dinghuibacter sp.]|nr:hypothetical protein [Dinghuibacter sp.]